MGSVHNTYAVTFLLKTSTLEGLKLADLAESVNEVTKTNTSANPLQTKRSDSNRGEAKEYPRGSQWFPRGV